MQNDFGMFIFYCTELRTTIFPETLALLMYQILWTSLVSKPPPSLLAIQMTKLLAWVDKIQQHNSGPSYPYLYDSAAFGHLTDCLVTHTFKFSPLIHVDLFPQYMHCKKGFVIFTIVFLTRTATVDMVLWDDTRIVPCDSQLWAIQCRNNWICYKGWEFT